MVFKVKSAEPYIDENGQWDVRSVVEDVEIDDKLLDGRPILCADCGMPSYPECRKWCIDEKEELQ